MKKLCALSIIIFIMAIAMTGCSSSDSGEPLSSITPQEENIPEQPEPVSTASLSGFKSESDLEQYLKNGLRLNAEEQVYRDDGLVNAAEEAPTSPAPESQESSDKAGGSFSKTNIQEAGVDEADIIKTDGQFLYIASSSMPHYYYLEDDVVIQDEEVETDEKPGGMNYKDPVIRILELSSNPADANEVAEIPVKDFENSVNGLYLLTDRGESKPDLLITTGGNAQNMWTDWYCCWCWTNGVAEIAIFNVDNPAKPGKISHLKLDGQLISSRRIKDKLYVVTRYTPNLPDYNKYPANKEEEENNKRVLDKATLSDLLPKAEINGTSKGSLVMADQCFLPPLNEDRKEEPDLITITAIDLNNPDNMVSRSIAGPVETFYMSTQSLYLASTSQYHGPFFGIPEIAVDTVDANDSETVKDEMYTPPPATTDLHKFALTENGPVYKGSGEVQGHLGWEMDKKPFRMSEYDNILRIATSLGDSWNNTSSTRLTLFKQGADETLKEIAHIDNIGEEGENLYASRFIGEKAYLVTFRVTDPLYVFDLSDPYKPIKTGELHIQGYSDYLHPISQDLILGIGKDAVPDMSSSETWRGRQGAWYQGVKLSLFDVSDPSNPSELDSIIIGKRGTEAGVLHDHHAMAYLPPANGQPARLALPISVHTTYPQYYEFDPSSPSSWYDWTHTGLYLFEIGSADISVAGEMIVSEADPNNEYWYEDITDDRAVLTESNVHYIHNSEVWSSTWTDPEMMSEPK